MRKVSEMCLLRDLHFRQNQRQEGVLYQYGQTSRTVTPLTAMLLNGLAYLEIIDSADPFFAARAHFWGGWQSDSRQLRRMR